MSETISFAPGTLFGELGTLEKRGITMVEVTDPAILTDKQELIRFAHEAARLAPNVLFSFTVEEALVDSKVVEALGNIYSSLTIPLPVLGGTGNAPGGETCSPRAGTKAASNKKAPSALAGTTSAGADAKAARKASAKKAALLNNAGLVFGYLITAEPALAGSATFTLKAFRDTVDFALEQYPNHLYIDTSRLAPTAVLSTQDIATVSRYARAIDTFYTSGRAVPWFLSVLKPLRLRPSVLLGDFAEWMELNNCGAATGFAPSQAKHTELEKMQLAFLRIKYEEKHAAPLFPAVEDIVKLHGAFARASCEEETAILDLSYTPDELFSPYALDIAQFYEETIMEACSVRVFPTPDGPDCMRI